MKRHAEILRPKFQAVLDAFEKELGGKGVASWKNPNGGYFISSMCSTAAQSVWARSAKRRV